MEELPANKQTKISRLYAAIWISRPKTIIDFSNKKMLISSNEAERWGWTAHMPAHATYICAFDVYTLYITRAGGGGGGVSYW